VPQRPRRATLVAAALWLAVWPGLSPATETPDLELKVKAAFLYNFARLVTWPPGKLASDIRPLEICILEQDPVGPALEEAFAGKAVEGHPLAVRRLPGTTGWTSCHIAYVGSSFPELTRDVLRNLTDAGVLTVHENPAALPDGVIRLYLADRKLRFEVNQSAAERGRLRLSSRLMSLAAVVHVDAQP
jgi:hypothetical protein